MAGWNLASTLLVVCILTPRAILGQDAGDMWMGFANTFGSLLDFTCPNNSVVTGIASDFSHTDLDRQWEFRCGTSSGLASVAISCTLEPSINTLQDEIVFSCPGGGYLAGFRSEFTSSSFDRQWQPYCCTRPASSLINCQTPTSRYENILRNNLNFTAPVGHIVTGVQSFYFNRDRRWRFETCQIEVSCGDPGTSANARRTGDSFLYRDQVTFLCNQGYYQSSGPVGGVRECLITGEWSGEQPICSQCVLIPACSQVSCSNSSDHQCLECDSNQGPLLGQSAYSNLGTQCQPLCSWLGETFCYPGVCPSTPESCDCIPGFQGPSCLQIVTTPTLSSCSLILESGSGTSLSTSCDTPTNETAGAGGSIFTNIVPYQLRGMWEGFYTGPTPLPPKPAYIPDDGYRVGVAVSEMSASILRAANPSDAVSHTLHRCQASPPSHDNPINGLTSCLALATPLSLANHTFLHGDTFEVLVRLGAGGYLDVLDLDTDITNRHLYQATPTEGGATFILDFQPPVHCSVVSPPSCSPPDAPLLSLSDGGGDGGDGGEIFTNGSVVVSRWEGWRDTLSGITHYLITLYPLEEVGGLLIEGAAISSASFNETAGTSYEYEVDLLVNGAYSFVLEVSDEAGNVQTSRRSLLYDITSTLNIDDSAPLIVTSALFQTGHVWQNSTSEPIRISGRGHFYNSLLRVSALLSPLGQYNSSPIAPGYDHPASGRYPRGGTPNAEGVVRLLYDFYVDQVGGASPESLSGPEEAGFRFETDDIGLEDINISTELRDGDCVRVWFQARDFKFQEINDSVLFHVDSSSPALDQLSLVRNGVSELALHGREQFTDLVIEFDTYDEHSGVSMLEWSIGTELGLDDVGRGGVPMQMVAMEDCRLLGNCSCDVTDTHCNFIHHEFSPRLSDLLTSDTSNHDADYYITVTSTNHALLSSSISLKFTVDTTPPLPGAVFDALPTQPDIDYQQDRTLQGWWAGFFDRETDIFLYQYVFSRECAEETNFTYPLDTGSVVMETNQTQAISEAPAEGTYYLTVVAWNHALSPSTPVCSDGVTIDTVPPTVESVVIPGAVVGRGLGVDGRGQVWMIEKDRQRVLVTGGSERSECNGATLIPDISLYPLKRYGDSAPVSVSADVCTSTPPFSPSPVTYLTRDHTLNISWDYSDNVGLRQFYIGTVPAQNYTGDESEVVYYETTGHAQYTLSGVETLWSGNQFFLSIRAEDLALHITTVTIGPILIDWTPPLVNGSLDVQRRGDGVMITWDEEAFVDNEEEVGTTLVYHYAIGLTRYGNEILSFKPLPLAPPPGCPSPLCIVPSPSYFITGQSYHFTISATNNADLASFLTSPPYRHVSATPTTGLVMDFDPWSSVEVVGGASYHMADIDVLLGGVRLGVRWRGMTHPSEGVVYSVALGSEPGRDDVVAITTLGEGVNEHVFPSPPLMEGVTYYSTVVAETTLTSSTSSSNGVLFLGATGDAQLARATVYDGVVSSPSGDVDYHGSTTSVAGAWSFPPQLHAHISHYMWGVVREIRDPIFSGSGSSGGSGVYAADDAVSVEVVVEYRNVGKDTSALTSFPPPSPPSPPSNASSSSYLNAVRGCFATQCLPAIFSDGFQLSSPPRPSALRAVYTPLEEIDLIYGVSSSGRFDLEWVESNDAELAYFEWSVSTDGDGGGGGGGGGRALVFPWVAVEVERERERGRGAYQLSLILNASLSLHHDNVVVLKIYNSAGLYGNTSVALEWSVGGLILPQALVPRQSLVVLDVVEGSGDEGEVVTDWRDIPFRDTCPQDIDYTNSSSSLSGAWPDLRYMVYNYSLSTQQAFTACSSPSNIRCGSTIRNHVTVSALSLVDGQVYYMCVRAQIEHAIHVTTATPTVLEACSNGVTVDLSPPVEGECVKIVSPLQAGLMTGGGAGSGRRGCDVIDTVATQISTSELYLVWNEFLDVEQHGNGFHASGVADYQFAIGTSPRGTDIIDYQSVGVATYAVARGLSLQSGITYYATIQAVDFTGRMSYAVSQGVTIDTTPPFIEVVELAGTTQFRSNFSLKWNIIRDDESEVTGLEWGLGTRPGSSDIVGWSEMSLQLDSEMRIDGSGLDLYDGEIVFASLKVTNDGGLVRVVTSTKYILDSSPPEVGVVYDGPAPGSVGDVDYLGVVDEVGAYWSGFSDPHTGIVDYSWAVGRCPSCVDTQPFTSVGLETAATRSKLLLSPGATYHVTVRACNPSGLCAEVSSNGVTVDATPPTPGQVLDGLYLEDIQHQPSPSIISAHWVGFHDAQSSLTTYIYYSGSSYNNSDLVPPTIIPSSHTSFIHYLATPLPSGTKVFTTVTALNRVGLASQAYSNGVLIDTTPPEPISDPVIVTEWVGSVTMATQLSGSALRARWDFTEDVNTPHQYFIRVASASRSRLPILPQVIVNADSASFTRLQLDDGDSYTISVLGCNTAGLCSSPSSSSDPVLIDATPPIDGFFAVSTDSVAGLDRTVPGGMTWRNRLVRGVAQLNIALLGFSDPHSGISSYWIGIGTGLGSFDLLSPAQLNVSLARNDSIQVHIGTVTLNRILNISETLYISLWALNGVGLRSHVIQESFRVGEESQTNNGTLDLIRAPMCSIDSCLGHCTCAARGYLCNVPPSLPTTCTSPSPIATISVFDRSPQLSSNGSTSSLPLFTSITDQLFGYWEFTDPSSATLVQRLEWAVGVMGVAPGEGLVDPEDGIVWKDAGSAMSAVFSVSEDYPLRDGGTYLFHVRAWYSSTEYAVFSSAGVTLDTLHPTAVRGRRVREGTPGEIDFTTDPSTLFVTWGGVFEEELSGNHLTFELGLGTAPGADDTYPLAPVLGSEVNLIGLSLQQGVVYYSIVRAANPLGMLSTSISDGIMVDMTPPTPGTVLGGMGMEYLESRAQTDTGVFSARWYGFADSESQIHHYELAITNSTAIPSLYDDMGIRLRITRTSLVLIPGQTYYAHIVAVNRAGLRSPDVVSKGVVIQPLPPRGRVCLERSEEILVNPSFENGTRNNTPCPPDPLPTGGVAYGWSLNTSYVTQVTYHQATPLSQTPPTDGCYSLGFIGIISQDFPSIRGNTYRLTFSYRHAVPTQQVEVSVALPGVKRVITQPYTTPYTTPTSYPSFVKWERGFLEFVAEEVSSSVSFTSPSDTLLFLDQVSITSCGQSVLSTSGTRPPPEAITIGHQVISGSKVRLSAVWSLEEEEGCGVREYWWGIGTVPGGVQLQDYQSTGLRPEATSEELDVSHNTSVYVSVVVAWSNGGRRRRREVFYSDPYLVDRTPPQLREGVVTILDGVEGELGGGGGDVDYQSSLVVGVDWRDILDEESGIEKCAWAVGSSPGWFDVQSFLPILILSSNQSSATSDLSSVLEHGNKVYSTVVCSNKGGLTISATTDGLTILNEPPSNENAIAMVTSPTYTTYASREGYVSDDMLTVKWVGFAESAGTGLEYEIRLLEEGEESGVMWVSVGSATMLSIDQLQVSENITGHVIEIRAVNLGGVVSEPISLNFSLVSTPPSDTGIEINATWSMTSELLLDWSGKFVSPAPLYYELSIGTQMGSGSVRKWVELSTTESSFSLPVLSSDRDYFVTVTAIASSGVQTTAVQLLAGLPISSGGGGAT